MQHCTCSGWFGRIILEVDQERIVAAIGVVDSECPFICKFLPGVDIFGGKIEAMGRRCHISVSPGIVVTRLAADFILHIRSRQRLAGHKNP